MKTHFDPVTIATFPVKSGKSRAGSKLFDWKIMVMDNSRQDTDYRLLFRIEESWEQLAHFCEDVIVSGLNSVWSTTHGVRGVVNLIRSIIYLHCDL